MLVLSRKVHETIIIGGTIRVTLVSIRGRQVRVAIEAPREIAIVREELDRGPAGALRSSRLSGDPSASPSRPRGTSLDRRTGALTPRRRTAGR